MRACVRGGVCERVCLYAGSVGLKSPVYCASMIQMCNSGAIHSARPRRNSSACHRRASSIMRSSSRDVSGIWACVRGGVWGARARVCVCVCVPRRVVSLSTSRIMGEHEIYVHPGFHRFAPTAPQQQCLPPAGEQHHEIFFSTCLVYGRANVDGCVEGGTCG